MKLADDEEAVTPEKLHISWDFRDEAWVYRPRSASDAKVRKSISVRSRTLPYGDLAGCSWEDARRKAYDEFAATLGLTS